MLFDVLEEHDGLEMDEVPARTEAEVASMPPCLFVAWCRDGDADFFAAVPDELVTPVLADALTTCGSRMFVGPEDMTPAAFGALLRLWATICPTIEGAPAAELWPWVEQETAHWSAEDKALLPDVAELTALSGVWDVGFGLEPEAYDRRYTRTWAIRQRS